MNQALLVDHETTDLMVRSPLILAKIITSQMILGQTDAHKRYGVRSLRAQ